MTARPFPWLQAISEPPSDGYGELVLEVHADERSTDRWATIHRADRRILVRRPLLRWWAQGKDLMLPWVTVYTSRICCTSPECGHSEGDSLEIQARLKIQARDRKVVYVIGEYDARRDAFAAEWPD